MGSDISLTFDNKMFLKGLDQISSKMGEVAANTAKGAAKMGSGVAMSVMSFLKANAALAAVKAGISKIAQNIPEIGRTFSIAGDIITRNFLWPLRQQLFPYLRQFLSWVRDHRAMFVRWGGALVSVFNIVITGIKAAINILKPFYEAAMKFFKDVFGKTGDSIDKIVNMVLFKISAVMVYLESVLKPVMQTIANIVFQIANAMKAFVEGLAEGYVKAGGLSDVIKLLGGALENLSDTLFSNTGFWKTFGDLLSVTIVPALKLLLLLITGIGEALSLMGDAMGLVFGKKLFDAGAIAEFETKHSTALAALGKGSGPAEATKRDASGHRVYDTVVKKDVEGNLDRAPITNITVHANTKEDAKVIAETIKETEIQRLQKVHNANMAAKG
jgi:hypothetical protein